MTEPDPLAPPTPEDIIRQLCADFRYWAFVNGPGRHEWTAVHGRTEITRNNPVALREAVQDAIKGTP